ncbi:hypothetical protein BT96DRAFT_1055472, partial [Gymnopus androsaceus JB14]
YGLGVDGAPPETPWFWNPETLHASSTANRPSNSSRQSSEPPPNQSKPSYSLSRHASEPPPDTGTCVCSSRKTEEASGLCTSASAYASSHRTGGSSSTTTTTSISTASAAAAASQQRPLQTTFTSRIVRTPDHYRNGNRGRDNGPPNSSLTRSSTMPSLASSVNQASTSGKRET